MSGTKDALGAPTQRGRNTVPMVSGSTFVAFPSGTLEGDIAVCIGSSGWEFNGGASSVAGLYNELVYTSGSGTPVSGWVFWVTVTAAMITAGGVTLVSEGATSNGMISIATFAPGVSVSLLDWSKQNAAGSYSLNAGGTGENDVFLFFAFNETGSTTVDFVNLGEDDTVSQATGTGAFTDHTPSAGSRLPVETVTFGSVTRGTFIACVRVSKGQQNRGLSVSAKGANSASVTERIISGKTYWEMKADAIVGTMGPGIVAGDFNYNAQMGIDRQSLFYQSNGLVRVNNQTLATISNYVAGDVVCIAFDPGSKLIWFRVNNGSWNNDGTANPATGVGGIDTNSTSNLTTGPVYWPNSSYPGVTFSTAGGCMTASFDDAEWAYSAPSGFISIEEIQVGPCMNADPMGFWANAAPDDSGDWLCRTPEFPEDNHTPMISFPAGPVKTIAGEVQEETVGVEGRLVRLYNRRTGEFVGEARTNALGEFVIPARDPSLPHFVVAFDDDIAPDYNAKVYDNVIPQ